MNAFRLNMAYAAVPILIEHAQKYHSERASQLGPNGLERFVGQAIESAKAYGLVSERSLARFLDLALVRGLPLPESLDLILRGKSPAEPNARLERAWRRLLFEIEAGL
jgi:hypothetical protein